jgi:hypothetical protein
VAFWAAPSQPSPAQCSGRGTARIARGSNQNVDLRQLVFEPDSQRGVRAPAGVPGASNCFAWRKLPRCGVGVTRGNEVRATARCDAEGFAALRRHS